MLEPAEVCVCVCRRRRCMAFMTAVTMLQVEATQSMLVRVALDPCLHHAATLCVGARLGAQTSPVSGQNSRALLARQCLALASEKETKPRGGDPKALAASKGATSYAYLATACSADCCRQTIEWQASRFPAPCTPRSDGVMERVRCGRLGVRPVRGRCKNGGSQHK